jgi:glycerol-3-phosphate cytidylyltransferase-like family protein
VDTRSKILTFEAALTIPERPVTIVTGTFDVLRAGDVRELNRARTGASRLLVVVLPGSSELLTLHARSELVAALRVVDYVVSAGPSEVGVLVQALESSQVVRLEEGDEGRRRQLKQRVLGECK